MMYNKNWKADRLADCCVTIAVHAWMRSSAYPPRRLDLSLLIAVSEHHTTHTMRR